MQSGIQILAQIPYATLYHDKYAHLIQKRHDRRITYSESCWQVQNFEDNFVSRERLDRHRGESLGQISVPFPLL